LIPEPKPPTTANLKTDRVDGSKGFLTLPVFRMQIPVPKPPEILQLESKWKKLSSTLTFSQKNVYGELTAGSLYKILHIMEYYVGLNEADKLLDPGAGDGKMFYALRFFFPLLNLPALGYEMDETVYASSMQISEKHPLVNVELRNADSQHVEDWTGVTIVYAFDGRPLNHIQTYHQKIMLALLRTSTVKCVFSTKMNKALLENYIFTEPDNSSIQRTWALVEIPELYYGRAKYTVSCCFRCNHNHLFNHCDDFLS
jgi:hypothetical protein